MNYEDAVLEFLAREENLLIAVEISERLEQLKVKLHKEFWFGLHSTLQEKLAQSEQSSKWEVWLTEEEELLDNWAGCGIEPISTTEVQRYLSVMLQQGARGSGYPLYYGIVWNTPLKTELNIEEVTALADELKEEGFKPGGQWWIGLKYLNYYPTRIEFLLQMATSKDDFVKEIAHTVWKLFEDKRPLIEAANRALATVSE